MKNIHKLKIGKKKANSLILIAIKDKQTKQTKNQRGVIKLIVSTCKDKNQIKKSSNRPPKLLTCKSKDSG